MYCRIADVRKFHDSGETNKEFEQAIREAMEMIDEECDDHFEPDDKTFNFDGTGHSDILFPELTLLRCLEITSIVIVDPADGSTTDVDSSDYKVYERRVTLEYDISLRASARWGDDAPIWPKGNQNVQITGKWGWKKTPRNIAKACAILAAQKMDDITEGISTEGDIKSAKLGDFSFTLEESGGTETGGTTGNKAVDRLLANYHNDVPQLGIV